MLKEGDILIALNRPILGGKLKVGRLGKTDVPAILYQRVGRFDIYDPSLKSYLFYYIQSPHFMKRFKRLLQGVDQPFMNKPGFLSIPVALPSLGEQQEIVKEIERKYSIAELTEDMLEKSLRRVERLRYSVLKTAFGGRLVPQDPGDESAEKLLGRIREERAKSKREKGTNRRRKNKPNQVELSSYVE
jgi:type I restriction enzyme S subunit